MEREMYDFNWDKFWKEEGQHPLKLDELTQKRFVALLNETFPDGARILHLGAGDGYLATQLEDKHSVLCVDSSKVAVDKAKAKGLEARHKDLQIIDFSEWEKDGYDAVILSHVLEALEDPFQPLKLAEMVMKEDGFMAFATRNKTPEFRQDERFPTINPFTERVLNNIVRTIFKVGKQVRTEVRNNKKDLLFFYGQPPEKTLALCLIVWNEAPFLERCLKSVPYDELIIGIDDASNDRLDGGKAENVYESDTYKIAKKYVEEAGLNSQVYTFEHMEKGTDSYNFSGCRNPGFEKATADYTIQIDGHEYLNAGARERVKDALRWAGEREVFHVIMHRDGLMYHVPHIWCNNDKYEYNLPVHNKIAYKDGGGDVHPELREILKSVHCLHEWTKDKANERQEQRDASNIRLLKKEVEENPDSARPWFFLGNSYLVFEDGEEKALEAYDEALKRVDINKKKEFFFQTKLLKAKVLARLKRWEESRNLLRELMGICLERNEHLLALGDVEKELGALERAERYYRTAAMFDKPPITHMFAEESAYSWEPYQRLYSLYKDNGVINRAYDMLLKAVEKMPRNWYEKDRDIIIPAFKEMESLLRGESSTGE